MKKYQLINPKKILKTRKNKLMSIFYHKTLNQNYNNHIIKKIVILLAKKINNAHEIVQSLVKYYFKKNILVQNLKTRNKKFLILTVKIKYHKLIHFQIYPM